MVSNLRTPHVMTVLAGDIRKTIERPPPTHRDTSARHQPKTTNFWASEATETQEKASRETTCKNVVF